MESKSDIELMKKVEVMKAVMIFSSVGAVVLFNVGSVLGAYFYHWLH